MLNDKNVSRRSALGILGALGVASTCACTASPNSSPASPSKSLIEPTSVSGGGENDSVQLILLGTGAGPVYYPTRVSASTALRINGKTYLVDAGLGAARRFRQANLTTSELTAIFVTHLHPDHTADLYNLLTYEPGEKGGKNGSRSAHSVQVYGPGDPGGLPAPKGSNTVIIDPGAPTTGLKGMLDGTLQANRHGLNTFSVESLTGAGYRDRFSAVDLMPPSSAGASISNTAPAMDPFLVYEDDSVRVSAILVPHGSVYPSFGFRFETEQSVIAFSGDTGRSDNVARLAAGADVLVHEVIDAAYYERGSSGRPNVHMRDHHTSPEDVGRVASQAGAKSVVLSHIGPGDPRDRSDDSWKSAVEQTYSGPVTVGQDLYRIGLDKKK